MEKNFTLTGQLDLTDNEKIDLAISVLLNGSKKNTGVSKSKLIRRCLELGFNKKYTCKIINCSSNLYDITLFNLRKYNVNNSYVYN